MKLFDKEKNKNRKYKNKIHFYHSLLFVFTILVTSHTVCAKVLFEGLDYDIYHSEAKQILHVLIIDPKKYTLKAVHANDKVQGLETVASLARQENAIAAINGGFFRMGEKTDGLPAGILKIAHRWFGVAYSSHGALGWSNKVIDPIKPEDSTNTGEMRVLMDRLQTKTLLELNATKFPVNGVNQPAIATKAILYNDAYGAQTDYIEDGIDILIQHDKIQAILPSGGNSVPMQGYIYSIGPEAKRPTIPLSIGQIATVKIKVNPIIKKHETEVWQTIENIVGGIPLLIDNGRVLPDSERMLASFVHQPHARTAVGILPSGRWIFVVVEKSHASGSPGMTLPELSIFLEKLGCHMALNLDGGGSSTLYLNGKVINNPENELDENIVLPISRRVGDAILVLPKKQS